MNDGRRTLLINPSFALFIGSSTMCDGKHEKAMSGGDTTGDNNDDFFACISQLNTAFFIQHAIVDSLDHCCCRIAVPMEQRHDLLRS